MNAITTILTHAREELAQKEFSFSRPESFVIDDKFAHLTDARLSTKDLNVYINGNHILKNVNVNIPKNRITCIIGPSGCGKSTLLRTFNRLNDSVEGLKMKGEVNLGGSNILSANSSKLSDLRRNIGLVPQRPCPLPMSIYDNVAYGCRIHGIRNHRKLDIIVRHYLQAVGLWGEVKDRLKTPAARLSGGQQQRLCLARSLAVEPSFLLADESTSALDPISSKRVEQLFTDLKKDYSIVMVTHTLRQALRVADYVIFMYLGEVIEAGEAKQIFNSPQNELTKNYLDGTFS
ncbi:MAG: phosphate ABC transporter ATP-binding protein [Prevotella sp.]|jgi:phosphate transport system ATP-binding protein|nr:MULTISPECIES: phosphate ABC transporter ATP-binding protein [unclassified Prevotella]MCH3969669.1 phosphate ABC transporter ATP-binding protein [Prevotella sp.]MCH3992759.1 phosphate ABC transporter ATP-binding protein [Prevotella sp.]MCH4185462.1 phosphate ABC transporter ATP-binding protein [Prevotella sp.]MCH4215498.1 phosphate ABC transporter ATP-binding protein [Prevotella sp.]MCH4250659.1 phosphate ABC transporter ATP-binding protein [Prevotella sp.]